MIGGSGVLTEFGYGEEIATLGKSLESQEVVELGTVINTERLYLCIKKSQIYDPDVAPKACFPNDLRIDVSGLYNTRVTPALMIHTVVVPLAQRRRGVFTAVLDALEAVAKAQGVPLCVGPFMEDDSSYITRVCSARGYTPIMPFSMVSH
jgi:hypothetical protein